MDDPPSVPWDDFALALDWRQGEHVALIGPTGKGKTTLALALVDHRPPAGRARPFRGHVPSVATKPRDDTLRGLVGAGWQRIKRWPPRPDTTRVLLWPPYRDPSDVPAQAGAISRALWRIFRVGGWCVVVDDVQYLTGRLGLGRLLTDYWLQSRALGISVVAATQRPRHVPVEMWGQSSHLFLWRCTDADDLRRISGLGSADTATVRRILPTLEDYDVLHVDARTGALTVTRAPRPPARGGR